uniref:Uncharacterized protein n=1 Tax=Oryza barthii TaxID=65489 RepID=A0A0D3FBV1_9ORYZ
MAAVSGSGNDDGREQPPNRDKHLLPSMRRQAKPITVVVESLESGDTPDPMRGPKEYRNSDTPHDFIDRYTLQVWLGWSKPKIIKSNDPK